MTTIRLSSMLLAVLVGLAAPAAAAWYFPPPGESLAHQDSRAPAAVGLDPDVVDQLQGSGSRWALWRHGYLVHVEGDFNQTDEVKSLVKVWFAMTVGAAIQQGKIPNYHQRLNVWQTQLTGNDALATWWHAITQSTGFDYPGCGDSNDYLPGRMWTYSDINMHELNQALAKAWGRTGYDDQYDLVWKQAFFDAIGMRGWSNEDAPDHARLVLDLEDMGRLGLFVMARGSWAGQSLVPGWFVEELERRQTRGMQVNYDGCNDGQIDLDPSEFPESPYGYLCWNNRRGDFYPGADTTWTFASGAGGFYILWNYRNGVVFAGVAVANTPQTDGVPHIIERNITGPNPLAGGFTPPTPGPAPGGPPAVSFAAPSPDPASESVTFSFDLARTVRVRLMVFDATGRLMSIVEDAELPAGPHSRTFDLRDRNGRVLPNGLYQARIEAGGTVVTRGFATVR